MTLSLFKKYAKDPTTPQSARDALAAYNRLRKSGVITENRAPGDRRQRVATDSRTVTRGGVHRVKPFFVSDTSVFIICPYCGDIHTHGNNSGDYTGGRVPHCSGAYKHRVYDYYIESMEG